MSKDIKSSLGDVQKTLLLPLWGRAVESTKPKPKLVDETAVQILKQIDFNFSQFEGKIDDITQIGWIRRSQICDQVVKAFLTIYPAGTIVDIGCGLETIFERTDNGQLKWYDIDLPDVIAFRSQFVKENARRKFIVTSFLDEGWMDLIIVDENVLFMAAGVFYYFEEEVIKEFILLLTDRFPNSEIIFDVTSPLGVKMANKKVVESAGFDEKSHLVWGLENENDILSWDPRIEIIDTYKYFRISGIGIRNRLMGMLSDLLGFQYMLHLKLGGLE